MTTAGFAAACEQGRNFGFDGKTLIHPGQIEAAIPSSRRREEIADASAFWPPLRKTLTKACSLDGRMVERLHAEKPRG